MLTESEKHETLLEYYRSVDRELAQIIVSFFQEHPKAPDATIHLWAGRRALVERFAVIRRNVFDTDREVIGTIDSIVEDGVKVSGVRVFEFQDVMSVLADGAIVVDLHRRTPRVVHVEDI